VGRFFNVVKHGFEAMGEAPEGDRAQLNTAGLSFFNLDWANRVATGLTRFRFACSET
jgi:hypothetical protein